MVHSHTSDYSTRPASLIHYPGGYTRPVQLKAVPLGEGEVDLVGFVRTLKEVGYDGYLSYEICGPVVGGGTEENLDKLCKHALTYMRRLTG
jgi:sugar phosphate isomerase/epimerase